MKTNKLSNVAQSSGNQFFLKMLLGGFIDQTRKKASMPQGFPYISVRRVFLFWANPSATSSCKPSAQRIAMILALPITLALRIQAANYSIWAPDAGLSYLVSYFNPSAFGMLKTSWMRSSDSETPQKRLLWSQKNASISLLPQIAFFWRQNRCGGSRQEAITFRYDNLVLYHSLQNPYEKVANRL